MINGNYFGNKGLLVSWSLFRAPKEKAESQEMLSPGRTCNIRGGKSWIGKGCWACILKWIIIISHGLIWRAFPDGSGGWLSLTPAGCWSVFCGCCQGRCAVLGVCALSSLSLQALTPFPQCWVPGTPSEAVFLLWFAALNWLWSLHWPCFVQRAVLLSVALGWRHRIY